MRTLKRIALRWLGSGIGRHFDANDIRRILVFRYDRIGDMVVTTPFLVALRRGFPRAHIDILCSRINAPVAQGLPGIDQLIIHRPSLLGLIQLLLFGRNRYDLVIDLNHSVIWYDLIAIRVLSPKHAASVYKSGRYGVAGKDLHLYNVMPPRHPLGMRRPISDVYLNLAKTLTGLADVESLNYTFAISPAEVQAAKCHIGVGEGDLVVGLNQHGGRPSMLLRDQDMLALCRHIRQALPRAVIVWFTTPYTVGGVRKLGRGLWDDRLRLWMPTDSIRPVMAFMTHVRLLVTPDTSLVHFAAAFKVPVVAVYANEPDLINQWVPQTTTIRVIRSDHPKSLEGYSKDALIKETDMLLKTLRVP
jgi:ADP-heptose:LPS heptosyltransferase